MLVCTVINFQSLMGKSRSTLVLAEKKEVPKKQCPPHAWEYSIKKGGHVCQICHKPAKG